jgi:hypothetical protein
MTTLPPSVSRLSRQCGILNVLQPYRPPEPVTGIALLLLTYRIRPYKSHLNSRLPVLRDLTLMLPLLLY